MRQDADGQHAEPREPAARRPALDDRRHHVERRRPERGEEHIGVYDGRHVQELGLQRDGQRRERLEPPPPTEQLAGDQPREHDDGHDRREVGEPHHEDAIEHRTADAAA